jgi:hypothetical protein
LNELHTENNRRINYLKFVFPDNRQKAGYSNSTTPPSIGGSSPGVGGPEAGTIDVAPDRTVVCAPGQDYVPFKKTCVKVATVKT